MKPRRTHVLIAVLAVCVCALSFRAKLRRRLSELARILRGKKTIAQRVAQYGEAVRARLSPRFDEIGVRYPPRKLTFVGLKHERLLEVWASRDGRRYRLLRAYPILGASGTLGPKLREGDRQVPEGLYRIESLNPNSLYHLSLRVNYPNHFDRAKGKLEGRRDLGGDIMIHGGDLSIGCLAMGDETVEDLFVLAAETGIENVSVILSPVDFRIRRLPQELPEAPAWTPELYGRIRQELMRPRK